MASIRKKTVNLVGVGSIELIKNPKSKRLKLAVTPKNTVRVSMPYYSSYKSGLSFAQRNVSWIKEHQKEQILISEGSQIGDHHHVYFEVSKKVKSRVQNNRIHVSYSATSSIDSPSVQSEAQKAAIRALRKEAQAYIPPLVSHYAHLYQLDYSDIKFKNMSTRWGSCSQDKTLNFSIYLMQLPEVLRHYVVIHEVCHLKHMNHSTRFWSLVSQADEHYLQHKNQLKSHSMQLITKP